MNIVSANYISSAVSIDGCPPGNIPEFAFIGRSNVGKSSLINMITGRPRLAKTSSSPGKTRTINHFLINESWYLADLPGYGYAKVSKKMREKFSGFIEEYLVKRESMMALFVLIDSRHGPMEQDMRFMERLGERGIPFVRVFTKSDKVPSRIVKRNIEEHNNEMLKVWEELPATFVTSSKSGRGREEILNLIEETRKLFQGSS